MSNSTSQTFGHRLAALRKEQGISQRDLAACAQLETSYLEKIEHGYSPAPSVRAIRALEKALRTAPDELFSVSGKLPPDLERELVCSPLLLQAARVLSQWDAETLTTWLRSAGTSEAVLARQGVSTRLARFDARDGKREPISADLRRATFARDNHECVYCSALSVLEVDHIHPVSLGGTNEPENLVTACHKCNAKKGNRNTPFVMVFGRFRSEIEGALL